MDFVANLADVKVGDRVVTSGLDGIYPPGFVIGQVEKVQDGQGLYKHIEIRPAVDFRALQTVLVVLDPPEKPKPGEGPGELKPGQIPPPTTTQNQPAGARRSRSGPARSPRHAAASGAGSERAGPARRDGAGPSPAASAQPAAPASQAPTAASAAAAHTGSAASSHRATPPRRRHLRPPRRRPRPVPGGAQ